MLVHHTITHFCRQIMYFCRESLLKVIFRESVNNIKFLLYSKISVGYNTQEVHGPHCSPEKQLQSINTSGIISLVEIGPMVLKKIISRRIYFLNFIIISPWKRTWPFIWTNFIPLHSRALCQVWLKLAFSLEEKIF